MNELKESKDMLETMQEMMRQLTVLTKVSLVFMILRNIETLMALSPTGTIIEGPREITIDDHLNI